ncbi:MAG: hypothetical protein KAH01_07170, partial [Caldisericia bacterium]|nr:hypothetical protein [Caldisericia bacterium]
TMKESIAAAGENAMPAIAYSILATTSRLAKNMSKEAAQEYYQEMAETVNKQWGTDKYGNNLFDIMTSDENIVNSLVGAAAGAGGAVHFTIPGEIYSYIQDNKIEKAQTEPSVEGTTELSDITEEEFNAAEGETVSEKLVSIFDTKLELKYPKTPQKSDGTYDNASLVVEAKGLFTDTISESIESINEFTAGTRKLEDLKLGSITGIIARNEETLSRIDMDALTADEVIEINSIKDEVKTLKKNARNIFDIQVKTHTLEEIDAMTVDTLVKTFGSHGRGSNEEGPNFSTKEEKDTYDDIYSKLSEDEQKFMKEQFIAKKIGDKRSEYISYQKASTARLTKQTLEEHFKDTFFKDKTGIVSRVSSFIENSIWATKIDDQIEGMKTYTKQFMMDNWNDGQGKPKKLEDITDAQLDEFLSMKSADTGPKWNKTEYFGSINSNKALTSISKLKEKKATYVTDKDTALRNDIETMIDKRNVKNEKIFEAADEAENQIHALFEKYKKDGIPDGKRNIKNLKTKRTNGSSTNKQATDEEIYSYIAKIHGDDSVAMTEANGKIFEVKFKDVINYIQKDEENGFVKYANMIANENEILESLIDPNGGFSINEEVRKQAEAIHEKEQKKAKAKTEKEEKKIKKQIEKLTVSSNKKIRTLSTKEFEETQKIIKELQKRLVEIEGEVEEREALIDDTDPNSLKLFQDKLLEDFKELTDGERKAAKNILEYENKNENLEADNNAIYKKINAIKKELKRLYDKREQIAKDLNESQSTKKKPINMSISEWNMLAYQRHIKAWEAIKRTIKRMYQRTKDLLDEMFTVSEEIKALQALKSSLHDDVTANKQAAEQNTRKQTTQRKKINDNGDALLKKNESSKTTKDKLANAMKARLGRLQHKLKAGNYPSISAHMLAAQANRKQVKSDKINPLKIPTDISTYAKVKNEAESILSFGSISSINHPILNTYLKRGFEFIGKNGVNIEQFLNEKTNDNWNFLSIDSPGMALLFDENGNINENLLTLIVLEADKMKVNSASQIYNKTSSEAERMLDMTYLTPAQMAFARDKTRRSHMANSAGDAVLTGMDMIQDKTGDTEAFARLRTSLGLLVVAYMEYNGDIEQNNVPIAEYNKILDQEGSTAEGKEGSSVTFMSRPADKQGKRSPFDKDELTKIREDIDELEKNGLSLRNSESVQFEKIKPRTAKERGSKRNPLMQPTDTLNHALNISEQQTFELRLDIIDLLLNMYTKEKGDTDTQVEEKNKAIALKAMGWESAESIDEKSMSYDSKQSLKAAMQEKEDEYDSILVLHKSIVDGTRANEMWFKYFTAKNNRLNIDSVTIDPQNKKEFHRWAVTPQNSNQLYSKNSLQEIIDAIGNKDSNTREYNSIGFFDGIAQAFGHGIDKTSSFQNQINTDLKKLKDSDTTVEFAYKIMQMSRKEQMQLIADG